jgi:hypothetical protein
MDFHQRSPDQLKSLLLIADPAKSLRPKFLEIR